MLAVCAKLHANEGAAEILRYDMTVYIYSLAVIQKQGKSGPDVYA